MKKGDRSERRKLPELSDMIEVHRNSLILMFVVSFSIIAIIILLSGIAIIQGRASARSELSITASNLTNLITLDINNTVHEIDLGLLSILDAVSKRQKTGQSNDRLFLNKVSREDFLYPDSIGFRVFGPDGRLRYGVSNIVNRNADMLPRDAFSQLRDTTGAKLIVTPPFFDPAAGEWLIAVARRITNPDGSFGGAISSGIPTRNIIKKFSALNLGSGGSVALYHTNYQIAARFPELKVGTTTISEQLRAVIVSGMQSVNFSNLSPVDGVLRTGHARKVGELPYYISLAFSDDDWLAEWRHGRNYLILVDAILIGLVLSGITIIYRILSGWQRSLKKQVIERTQQLVDALDFNDAILQQAENKNTELDRFAYTVSHDLKSPLITIQAYAGMIIQDMEAGKYERAQDDMKRIEGAAGKMNDLLDDLLKLSRAGKMMGQPSPVDMNRLVKDVSQQLSGSIAESSVKISIQPDLPPVFGDRTRIAEVVQNLIENAIKYMGDQASPLIEIGTRQDGKEPAFFVRDNGKGIDPSHHEKVFGLFDKLDAKSKGTGVGLALVNRIIEAHGGQVWVESEGTGYGSTFYFTLPGGSDC